MPRRYYENQLTKNTMAISEASDSLETIENWSTNDRKELENEVHNHLDAQEKLLKEQKERKLRFGHAVEAAAAEWFGHRT